MIPTRDRSVPLRARAVAGPLQVLRPRPGGLLSLVTCAFLLFSCGEPGQDPLSHDTGPNGAPQGIPDGSFVPLAFLGAPSGPVPAAKKVGAKRRIRARKGGTVALHWEFDADAAEVDLDVAVRIHPGALARDTRISIGLEDPWSSVTLNFGKEGTQFSIPAEVTIDVEGLDLSGQDPTSINLYWLDPDSRTWYPVTRRDLKVDGDGLTGTWLLDHFSRYSLSGGGGT